MRIEVNRAQDRLRIVTDKDEVIELKRHEVREFMARVQRGLAELQSPVKNEWEVVL